MAWLAGLFTLARWAPLLGRIRQGAVWLFKHPMAALALVLAVWGWAGHRRADKWQAQASKTLATLTRERAAAQAAKLAAEEKSRKDAQDAQAKHDALIAGADQRFAAYAAAHGLRTPTAHPARPAQGDHPALPEIPSAQAIMAELDSVWITRADWWACDADWAYAQGAHDWAQRQGE